ncbi:hypothetical protein SHI21_04115 [Bacteriovorax sp. PP10]|uniref:Lipoprotein n=1 Tax=Bacteriovorax antarcticus TaxID=3088717 RepID=A0ABU5VQQ3_9BACT|nr:hypothetical protein [Bacteriovorax sp. PP10]MEA9355368.1 hypothetical protein [Bacteriovorax sp. PP10]
MKNFTFKAFLLVTTMSLTSSCALMLPDRSFIDEMDRESMYSPGRDFPVVAGDTGDMRISKEELKSRTPSSERARHLNKEAASIEQELIQKEDQMDEVERERYAMDKKFLQTDSDKLYYLSLGQFDRSSYIDTKKSDLKDDLERGRNMVQKRSIHGNELFLGMDKSEVVEIWGKPARVEIAGNPANQNERWSFREDGNVRQVYFEGGKVQGWALDL